MTRAPWDITEEMFLSLTEIERLLTHVRPHARTRNRQRPRSGEVDRFIIELLLFSGVRCSEFCALTLADTAVATHKPAIRVRGKRGSGRTVWLPQHVNELVIDFASRVRPALLPPNVRPDDTHQPLVFNERKRPYERTGLYRRVVRILDAAGLGARASVQLLRHTYGYLAYLRSGGNLLFVQRQLGHAHPMITSIYAQFVREPYAELANALPGSFAPAGKRSSRRKKTRKLETTR